MRLSEVDVNKLSREQITIILFGNEQDDGKQGDCIFVYGGRGIERVNKAVELYRNKHLVSSAIASEIGLWVWM